MKVFYEAQLHEDASTGKWSMTLRITRSDKPDAWTSPLVQLNASTEAEANAEAEKQIKALHAAVLA